jgi:hypothetical protein
MTSNTDLAREKQLQRRGRIMGAAIMAVIFFPMAVAYTIYHTGIGMPGSTINRGDLLDPPQAFQSLQPHQLDGSPWLLDEHKRKWRWLIPGGAECNTQCQQNLYLSRQVHIRLAEKSYRVERFYLLLDDTITENTLRFLHDEHPHVTVVKLNKDTLEAALAAAGQPEALEQHRYFLMDQEGFVMMSYSPAHTGQQLLDDIKRLLKFSYED